MKFTLILIILSVAINFALTNKLPERAKFKSFQKTDKDNEIDSHQDGFSGDKENLEKEIVKNVQVIKFDLHVLPTSSENIHVELDASQFGNFNSEKLNTLRKSLDSYAADLLAKYGFKGIKMRIRNVKFGTVVVDDFAHYATTAECQNDPNQIAENHKVCEAISRVIILNFSVNELLIYYHEIGYSENVSLMELPQLTTNDDFFFIEAANEELEIITERAVNIDDLDFPNIEESAVEYLSDDYNEENYEIIDSAEVNRDDYYEYSDLEINYTTRLAENEFLVQAFMLKNFDKTYDNTEQFKMKFKRYFESTYDSNPILNNSKVSVELVNATNYKNETEVWLLMKTENINITDSDLMLQDGSIFDDIFYDFDVYEFEFEDQLDIDENSKIIIADGESETPTFEDYRNAAKNQSLDLIQDFRKISNDTSLETLTEYETSIAANINSSDDFYDNLSETEEFELLDNFDFELEREMQDALNRSRSESKNSSWILIGIVIAGFLIKF